MLISPSMLPAHHITNLCGMSIIACGRGFKGPSMHDLRGSLLHKEVASIEEYLIDFKVSWAKTGCTIMSDGWSDGRNHTIINFLVSCPQGTMFLRSVDASDRVKDVNMLFELLDEVVMEVGVGNVVQVITDNASNYVLAGKMLEEKHKTIFWTPCAAHCIDLMLEDIGQTRMDQKHYRACQKHHKVHLQPLMGFEPDEEKHREKRTC
jgi:hypothetical protein